MREAYSYIRSPEVRQQVDQLTEELFGGERSPRTIATAWARNYIAYYFYTCDRARDARPLLYALGNAYTVIPWGSNRNKAGKAFTAAQLDAEEEDT